MTQDRYCKLEDGTVKTFEEVLAGEIFQIYEPKGVILKSLCENKFTWFKSESTYDEEYQGFFGTWIK